MFNTIGFNNFYMNNFMPVFGMNPFMGGCYNSFNPMFQFGMMNSLFGMPQMFSFPSFSMPMFSPFSMSNSMMPMGGNIFSMATPAMAMSAMNPMAGLSTMFNGINLLNQYTSNFGSLLTKKAEKADADTDNSPIKDTGKLDKHFLKKTKKIAKKLNCDYQDLLALMNSESGLNPKATCGSYVGLIQFGDAAITELRTKCGCKGLTKEKILSMSRIEQLDLVEKLLMYNKKWKFAPNAKLSAGDLYAMILAPGRADREVLYSRGESGYNKTNAKMDYNNDGKITKSEMSRRIREKSVNESIFA